VKVTLAPKGAGLRDGVRVVVVAVLVTVTVIGGDETEALSLDEPP
jgi:hypothetical protein